jgi:hypothetical protein
LLLNHKFFKKIIYILYQNYVTLSWTEIKN